MSGTVKADAADKTIFIFTNKLKPVINIDLTKKWDKATGETIPASINIQLQRRVKDSDNWEAVKYATPGQTAADYITLKKIHIIRIRLNGHFHLPDWTDMQMILMEK